MMHADHVARQESRGEHSFGTYTSNDLTSCSPSSPQTSLDTSWDTICSLNSTGASALFPGVAANIRGHPLNKGSIRSQKYSTRFSSHACASCTTEPQRSGLRKGIREVDV